MADTIRELVDNFNLKKEVDWGLLGVIADAFREEGEELLADYLQLCVETCSIPDIRHNPRFVAYWFMWRETALCTVTHLSPTLLSFVSLMEDSDVAKPPSPSTDLFYRLFLWQYLQTVGSFQNFKYLNMNVVLPDYCLTLTSKMWPNYDCKGKTLGQIKKELSK